MQPIKISGVGRMADNEKAILLIASRKPTDDELRALHEWTRNIGDEEALGCALDRLDNFVAGLVNMTSVADRTHVEALRSGLPEVAAQLRDALRWKNAFSPPAVS